VRIRAADAIVGHRDQAGAALLADVDADLPASPPGFWSPRSWSPSWSTA
jgi:hypothetical protein